MVRVLFVLKWDGLDGDSLEVVGMLDIINLGWGIRVLFLIGFNFFIVEDFGFLKGIVFRLFMLVFEVFIGFVVVVFLEFRVFILWCFSNFDIVEVEFIFLDLFVIFWGSLVRVLDWEEICGMGNFIILNFFWM